MSPVGFDDRVIRVYSVKRVETANIEVSCSWV